MADFKIFWLAFFALCCWFEASDGGYLITTPSVYRTGTVQRLNVHLHGNNMMWKVTASLKTHSANKTISVATKTVPGNSYSTIDIKVPQNVTVKDNTNIKLQVHGVSQDGKHQFKKEHQLFLEKTENKETFFIQTEKSTYNPGQTVRIRVIGVKHDLTPLEGKVKRVFILDPKGVRMAQWDDVDFKNGIANVEMPLSKQPVLGKWTIVASYQLTVNQTQGTPTYEDNTKRTLIYGCPNFPPAEECPSDDERDHDCSSDSDCSDLSYHSDAYKCCVDGCDKRCVPAFPKTLPTRKFKIFDSKTVSTKNKQAKKVIIVKKYVLPKFKVIIEPPSFVAIDSKHVSGRICARYKHGQPVIGDMKAVIATEVKEYKTTPACPTFPPPEECPDEPDNDCSSDSECSDLSNHSDAYKCCVDGCDKRCVPAMPITGPTGDFKIYASKTVSTKFKGCVQFSFTNEDFGLINSSFTSNYFRNNAKLIINANVTEEVTGVTKSRHTETEIEPFRLKITFNPDTTRYFWPGLAFTDVLSVTTIDGKPANNEKVNIIAQSQGNVKIFEKQYTVYDGIIHYEIPTIPSNVKTLYIKATHHKSKEYLPSWTSKSQIIATPKLSKSSSFLSIKRGLKTFKAGETAKIDLMLTVSGDEENNDFVYQLMCAGQIHVSGKTRLSSFKRTSQTTAEGSLGFSLPQTLPVSSCRLLVYYMRKDGEVVPDSISLKVQGKLRNQVVVRFNNKHREPGERVQITLKAAPGSTVVLSAIDKRLRQETEDITVDKVLGFREKLDVGPARNSLRLDTKIKDADNTFYEAGFVYLSDSPTFALPEQPRGNTSSSSSSSGWRRWAFFSQPGMPIGIERFPRQVSPRNPQTPGLQKSLKKSKQQQGQELETWLWTEETVSKSNSERIITARVPDSITSWHLSAFAMSSTHGMGVAEPSSLTVTRPFFVSVTAPYAVVREEKVSIVTRVFSYIKTCATVVIQLKPTNDFQLISTNNQRLCICGDEANIVNHVIKPTKVGKVSLTVTVKNVAPSLCKNPSQEPSLGISDSETRVLRVEAEGDSQEYTYSDTICPGLGKYEDEIKLDLPKDVVPDSTHATFSVSGDVMGPTLKGFGKIIKLPTGCGEQNMVNFAPNIYVMQYLNSTNLAVDDIMKKAAGFLTTGYQRELTYKRHDGSYSAFGNKDKEGSLWLTAFVLRSFSQASQFIFIDEKEIENITRWIESKQLGSGCFEKHGKLFRKELKGGVSSSVTLTAYVIIALLESNVNPQSDIIVKALRCIVNKKDSVTDSYSNAIIAYALTLAKHPARASFLKRLASQAIVKDGKMHWEYSNQRKQSGPIRPHHRSSSINIEMTGYALMAIIGDGTNAKSLSKARPIVKWLSNQRNGHGGFSSTQDTCVALQALSVFGRYVYGELVDYVKLHAGHNHPKTWMVIDIDDQKGFKQKFRVTHNKRLVLQRVELPGQNLPTKLKMKAVGRGCALVQADVSYNIKTILAGRSFQISSSVRRRRDSKTPVLRTDAGEKLCHPLEINVCAQWREKDESDMAVIEVKLVSGFEPDEESLEKLLNRKADVVLKRFEIEDTKVVLYFDEIKDVCVTFGIDQTSVVMSMRPATVTVYDYYDPDKSASSQYTITNDLCTTQPGA